MKPMIRRTTSLLLPALLLTLAAAAQTPTDPSPTEERLRELRMQISQTEARLSETSEAEEATMQTLRDLDREIAVRKELTASYEARMVELTLENDSLREAMSAFEGEFDDLKTQFRGHAVHAYKYGRMHELALILSASSINEMLIRVRYLNRFAEQRRARLTKLQEAARELEDRRAELVEARVQTQLLLREAQEEQRKMQRLLQSRQGVVRKLRSQRSSLEKDLNQQRTAATALEGKIRELLASATARRREAGTRPEDDVAFTRLTGSFRQNQGRLPWPARGVVVEPFGELVNPVHGTRTPNPGLLIATTPQAEVRAVFDGTVLGVSVLPEYGTYVAIQHGEYQSVYSNFSMLYIAEGDRVQAGQVIGRAGTDAEPKQAGVFFGLFKNGSPFDPSPWLSPR